MKKVFAAIIFLCCFSFLSAQADKKTDSSENFIVPGIAVVVLAIVGYLVYRFFKKTEEKKADLIPVIKKIYPSPSHGPITIEIQGKTSQLKILNMSGHQIGSFAITGS